MSALRQRLAAAAGTWWAWTLAGWAIWGLSLWITAWLILPAMAFWLASVGVAGGPFWRRLACALVGHEWATEGSSRELEAGVELAWTTACGRCHETFRGQVTIDGVGIDAARLGPRSTFHN